MGGRGEKEESNREIDLKDRQNQKSVTLDKPFNHGVISSFLICKRLEQVSFDHIF